MKYDEAIVLWAERRLKRAKIPFDAVDKAGIEYGYQEGCPTCGGMVTFNAWIRYHPQGIKKPAYFREEATLDNMLQELFEVSE